MKLIRYLIVSLAWVSFQVSDARVRPNGSRLWDFSKETIEQEADYIITQADIPLTITLPGVYRLAEALSATSATVITIASDNVVLDLNGKTISGSLGIALAIDADIRNVHIENGFIVGAPSFSNGLIINANDSDISVKNVEFSNFSAPGLAAILIQSANNIIFDHCLFSGSTIDLMQTTTVNELIIKNCSFSSAQDSNALNLQQVSNSLVIDSTFNLLTTGIIASGVQSSVFQNCALSQCASAGLNFSQSNNNWVKNCFISGLSSDTPIAGIISSGGNGNVFENCIVNGVATTATNSASLAAGFLLAPGEQCSKIIGCESCNITGPGNGFANAYGILLQSIMDPIQTITASYSLTTGINQFHRALSWAPDADFIAAGSTESGRNQIDLFEYNRATNEFTLTDTLAIANGGNAVAWNPVSPYLAYITFTTVNVVQFDRLNKKFGTIVATATYGNSPFDISWSNDGRFLAVCGFPVAGVDLRIYEFNFTTGTLTNIHNLSSNLTLSVVAWHPSGDYLAVYDGSFITIYAFNKNSNSFALTLTTSISPALQIVGLNWSFDGKYLTAEELAGSLLVYQFDAATGTISLVSQAVTGTNTPFAQWSADGKFILTTDLSNVQVYAFNRQTNTLTLVQTFPLFAFIGRWSPDGALMATGFSTNISILTGLTFPQRNILRDNIVYCVTGEPLAEGIGIAGSSIENLIIGNSSYHNDYNYQFVTNLYSQGLTGVPTLIQNLNLPPL